MIPLSDLAMPPFVLKLLIMINATADDTSPPVRTLLHRAHMKPQGIHFERLVRFIPPRMHPNLHVYKSTMNRQGSKAIRFEFRPSTIHCNWIFTAVDNNSLKLRDGKLSIQCFSVLYLVSLGSYGTNCP